MARKNQGFFYKNLALLAKTHPQEAIHLQNLDCSYAELFKTKKGFWNISCKDYLLFDVEDPYDLLEKWFEKLQKEGIEALFIYGAELGLLYPIAKKWLDEDPQRSLVLLEDDPVFLYYLLHLEETKNLLEDAQVYYYFLHSLDAKEERFLEIFWQFQKSTCSICATPFSLKYREGRYAKIRSKILYDKSHKGDSVREYFNCGASYYNNFYKNLNDLPKSHLASAFYGKFKGIPAIICGAGPSLEKNIDMLPALKDKALIFAGGSALLALENQGITPHFGVGIDPNRAQLQRIESLKEGGYPFFYRNRIYYKVLEKIKGPKIYVQGSGGYDTAAFFEKKLGIKEEVEEIEEGHNVVNFAISLAERLGCSPIILVGCDLSYSAKGFYAKGVIYSKEEFKKDQEIVPKLDQYGNPIYTLWKWIAEAEWIEKFAEKTDSPPLYNATEGGLVMEKIVSLSLQEATEKYLQKDYVMQKKIDALLKSSSLDFIAPLKIAQEKESLKVSLKSCLHILNALEEHVKMSKSVHGGKIALLELELSDEPAFSAVLAAFNLIYNALLARELFKRKKKGRAMHKALAELSLKKYAFLKDVTEVNLKLIEHS
jgi:hypothetical protein